MKIYELLDIWSAMKLPVDEFDGYIQRNGSADTFLILLREIRLRSGDTFCGKLTEEGEPCRLMKHSFGSCWGDSDVGSSEPLPASRGT